ncbi:MAG TPA: hypothetical protein DCO69_01380 [Clostridiales bacterium]|nr:hypothetical protein [Clostridiales bacterium]HBK04021.1 hypothetical protein [Clostridiales bacterium]
MTFVLLGHFAFLRQSLFLGMFPKKGRLSMFKLPKADNFRIFVEKIPKMRYDIRDMEKSILDDRRQP